MKIYKTQKQVEKDIKCGVLNCDNEDVSFECDILIDADIINARNINAWDINAWDINARNINAEDINARNINAWDINAWDINARNINAWDINAGDINAWDISYYAFCLSYNSIKCSSITARREIYQEPICLDGSLEIKPDTDLSGKKVKIELDGKSYMATID